MCDDYQNSGLPGAIRAPPVVHKEVASLAGLSLFWASSKSKDKEFFWMCWRSAHFVMYHVH